MFGLGKEKFKVPDDHLLRSSDEELEELTSQTDDINPTDHDLAAVVRRYLGIKLDKATIKLGGADWGRRDISPEQRLYMMEDVRHLPALWEVLERELKEAQLDQIFRERMEFFPHLNQIKMIGNPIDPLLCEADHKTVTAEKEAVREELRVMFADYRAPIPKSRLKTLKVQVEGGKFKRVPGPTEEEFSPSNRDHVLGALAHRGICVENVQEATLRKIDSPECRLLLKYSDGQETAQCDQGGRPIDFSGRTGESSRLESVGGPHGENHLERAEFAAGAPKLADGLSSGSSPALALWDLGSIELVIMAVVTRDPGLIDLLRRG